MQARNAAMEVCSGRAAAIAKQEALEAMAGVVREQIAQCSLDCGGDDIDLGRIGWGCRRPSRSAPLPTQPRALRSEVRGNGSVVLSWRPGPGSSRGPAISWNIERRAAADYEGCWQLAATTFNKRIVLSGEPAGVVMLYRVRGANHSGQGFPSSAAMVILPPGAKQRQKKRPPRSDDYGTDADRPGPGPSASAWKAPHRELATAASAAEMD